MAARFLRRFSGKSPLGIAVTSVVIALLLSCGCSRPEQPSPPPSSARRALPEQKNEAPFQAEVFVGGEKTRVFSIPFIQVLQPTDYVVFRPNHAALHQPTLGVRVLTHRENRPVKLGDGDLRLTTDARLIKPRIEEIRAPELVYELEYDLRAAEYRFEVARPMRLAFKLADAPLAWPRRDDEYLRPDPFAASDIHPSFARAKYWIDYFAFGAYQHSFSNTPFERCSRQDDYLVIYFREPGLRRPRLSAQIDAFNTPAVTELAADSFTVIADGKPIASKVRRARRSGESLPEVDWKLPSGTRLAIVRINVPARFRFAVADGALRWKDLPKVAPAGAATPGSQPSATRVAPTNNEPCFP